MNRMLNIPYGEGSLPLEIPADRLLGYGVPLEVPPVENVRGELRQALQHPVQSPPLRQIARGKRNAAIVIDDSTRAVPSAVLLDAVMEELQAGGIEPDRVTVIAATGLHRPMTEEEFRRSLGQWHGRVAAVNHNANDPGGLVPLCTTSMGSEIRVNRIFAEADLRILTGDVEHHQFCGYGGGAKSIYPGLSDADAIRHNHSRMDLAGTGPGRLEGNPVRKEIDEAGANARIDFLLSVVLNPRHEIVSVQAGNWMEAFRLACPIVDRIYTAHVSAEADLVIASAGGHPKDGTLYQAQKALRNAVSAVRPGGTVILAAACPEGSGSELFESWMEEAYDPQDVIDRIRGHFVMGGHKAYQVAREVESAKVYLYSKLPPGRVRSWFINPIRDWSDVTAMAADSKSVTVLPQASLTTVNIAA